MAYFKILLTDGEIIWFQKQCTDLNYDNDIYLVCQKVLNGQKLTLGLIPHEKIKAILRCE